jgi:hypothetical protein
VNGRSVFHVFAYPALAAGAGWLGADRYGPGECAAVVLVAAGVLLCESVMASGIAGSSRPLGREGRASLGGTTLACGMALLAATLAPGQPEERRVDRHFGEARSAFLARAAVEFSR